MTTASRRVALSPALVLLLVVLMADISNAMLSTKGSRLLRPAGQRAFSSTLQTRGNPLPSGTGTGGADPAPTPDLSEVRQPPRYKDSLTHQQRMEMAERMRDMQHRSKMWEKELAYNPAAGQQQGATSVPFEPAEGPLDPPRMPTPEEIASIKPLLDAVRQFIRSKPAADFSKAMMDHYRLIEICDEHGDFGLLPPLKKYQQELSLPLTTEDLEQVLEYVGTAALRNEPLRLGLQALIQEHGKDPFTFVAKAQTPEGAEVMEAAVGFLVMLDRLVIMTREHPATLRALQKHFVGPAFLGEAMTLAKTQGWFSIVKFVSVQAAMQASIKWLVDDRKGVNTPGELESWLLPVNIAEACVADMFKGNQDNAVAGLTLAWFRNGQAETDQPNGEGPTEVVRGPGAEQRTLAVKHALPRKWSDLYLSWNLLFLASASPQWPLYIAMLLNPQTIGQHHEPDKKDAFMHNRVVALYVGISTILKYRAAKAKDPTSLQGRIEGANFIDDSSKRLAHVFGKINMQVAEKYTREVSGDEKVFEENWKGITKLATDLKVRPVSTMCVSLKKEMALVMKKAVKRAFGKVVELAQCNVADYQNEDLARETTTTTTPSSTTPTLDHRQLVADVLKEGPKSKLPDVHLPAHVMGVAEQPLVKLVDRHARKNDKEQRK